MVETACCALHESKRRGLLEQLDDPKVLFALVLLLYLTFSLARLSMLNWQVSLFLLAGEHYVDPPLAPAGLLFLRNSDGYDGQFFYRLALNP